MNGISKYANKFAQVRIRCETVWWQWLKDCIRCYQKSLTILFLEAAFYRHLHIHLKCRARNLAVIRSHYERMEMLDSLYDMSGSRLQNEVARPGDVMTVSRTGDAHFTTFISKKRPSLPTVNARCLYNKHSMCLHVSTYEAPPCFKFRVPIHVTLWSYIIILVNKTFSHFT